MIDNIARAACLLIVLLLLSACGSNHIQRTGTETMDRWETLVRWSEFDALVDFIHPDYLQTNPVMQLDVDRLHQFRVTEYRIRQILTTPDGLSVERVVRMSMYHIHSAQQRVINHREVWRYDSERRAWLLHSGLPDPRQT